MAVSLEKRFQDLNLGPLSQEQSLLSPWPPLHGRSSSVGNMSSIPGHCLIGRKNSSCAIYEATWKEVRGSESRWKYQSLIAKIFCHTEAGIVNEIFVKNQILTQWQISVLLWKKKKPQPWKTFLFNKNASLSFFSLKLFFLKSVGQNNFEKNKKLHDCVLLF